jgi:hypothetical protein
MNEKNPPSAARWMLEHWIAAADREALGGDLLEEFRAGRGAAWYWRQTLAAVAIAWARALGARRSVAAFALVWFAPSAWLWLAMARYIHHSALSGRVWSLAWPWSMVCSILEFAAPQIVCVWTGMAAYLLLRRWITPSAGRARGGRGAGTGAIAWALLTLAVVAVPYAGRGLNLETATAWTVAENPYFWLQQMPGLLALVAGVWAATRAGRFPLANRPDLSIAR